MPESSTANSDVPETSCAELLYTTTRTTSRNITMRSVVPSVKQSAGFVPYAGDDGRKKKQPGIRTANPIPEDVQKSNNKYGW